MKLLGQGPELGRALAAARALHLHHGLLLEGARGAGKSSAALVLAQALLCESVDRELPCGQCAACGLVAAGAHPDLHVVGVLDDKHDISVDQVRELQGTLERSAFQGRARVAILDPADLLTEQAQNALLKTLEEPGAGTFLLLPTARPEALLATVLSRVGRLRMLPLDDGVVAQALAELGVGDPNHRALATRLARGSLGLAQELLAEGVLAFHLSLVDYLASPNEMSVVALARAGLHGLGRDDAERRARLVLWCARSHLRSTWLPLLAPPDSCAYPARGHAAWADVFDILFEAEADLDLKIAAEPVLCAAFLRIQDALR